MKYIFYQLFFVKANNNSPKVFISKKEISAGNWTIWHIGEGIGLVGGLMLLPVTCFLIIFQIVSGEKPIGVWLLLAVLPLWIMGALCFDKVEEMEKTFVSSRE